ncbi:MAG TPA: hypothetical protein PKE63_07345 [Lacibacter sp.]|nr:hypothetical protein [Lacibacter sp.]HMO88756.1 hypothetical protein [Lacibacter sp.]HMP87077.1 hypothetical protein [Lacibacter sp.]
MNTIKQFSLFALAVLFLSSCIKVNIEDNTGGSGGGTNQDDPNVTRVLQGSYERNITLDGGKYTMKGYVYFQAGTTLRIPEGTILVSDIAQKGAIIIERGAKIEALGSATRPIIFTSGNTPGNRKRGDWGGIILLGNAPTNRPLSPAPLIEGGVDRRYGGSNPDDNSGTMRYCRIEWAGIAAEPGSEINGLTTGGVGRGTVLEYIQVSYGNDDAFEFFGGNHNAKYLVAYATSDDDLDFDFGYNGNIQFAIVQRRPEIADTDAGNGVESDNDGSGTFASPRTRPVLSNITWIGPNGAPNTEANINFANRWRRNSQFVVRNSIMMGFPQAGFSIESRRSAEAYLADSSIFENNLVHAVANPYRSSDTAAQNVISSAALRTRAEARNNTTYANAGDIQLEAPFNFDAPNYLPRAGSPALSGASFTGLPSFFQVVTYRGGVSAADNWLANWTSFTPQTNVY